jgi:hypothetical protein
VGAAVRALIPRFFGAELAAHPRFPEVRDLLFTSMRGVGVAYAMEHRDPRTDPHLTLWKSVARTLLS